MENIPFIKNFIKLIENLSSVGNISLNASHNLWGTPVSGFNVTTGTCINRSSVPHEYVTLLRTLYSKFSLQVADSLPYFSEAEDMKSKIILRGYSLYAIFTSNQLYFRRTLHHRLKCTENSCQFED